MLAVIAVALWTDRLTSVTHVLCLAAGVVVLLDPWAVIWPGFWLSFGAVATILYATVGRAETHHRSGDLVALGVGAALAGTAAGHTAGGPSPALRQPRRLPLTRRQRWMADLKMAARVQYAVTVGLVPLTMLLFAQVSVVSPLANAVAIPVVSLLVTPLALAGAVLPDLLAAPLLAGARDRLAAGADTAVDERQPHRRLDSAHAATVGILLGAVRHRVDAGAARLAAALAGCRRMDPAAHGRSQSSA